MRLSFKGKSAIVTGACGGMGFETTKKLLKNNIKTLMLDIKTPPKYFLQNNSKVFFKKIDITNYKKLKKIIDNFYKKNKSVDYLINTTGVLWFDKDISSVKIDFSVWDKVYEINLKTMVYLSKIVIPKMVKNNFGSMVHI
ncbi:MAG TPA: SDR family NAD(P)-dependent oxidoreductase, partial [Candidatus Pelagibacter sp.]|nr:SDR family NAD(P)-dependent oxidoreductase [Candidatus Pelagibacter sp.]